MRRGYVGCGVAMTGCGVAMWLVRQAAILHKIRWTKPKTSDLILHVIGTCFYIFIVDVFFAKLPELGRTNVVF